MVMPPRPYSKTTSFDDFAGNNPSGPLPGASLDVEFSNIQNVLSDAEHARRMLQRDDGALKNGVVTRDALAPDLVAELKGEVGADAGVVANAALAAANAADAKAGVALQHVGETDNPHGVTAEQVGNQTAQWNAKWIQGLEYTPPVLKQGCFYAYDAVLGKMTMTSSDGVVTMIQQGVETQVVSSSTAVATAVCQGYIPQFDAKLAAAQSARTGAETAQAAAVEARTGAETAQAIAVSAKVNAAAAGDVASAAQTAAEIAKAQAEAARDITLDALDHFDDRYLGPKASDPATDNDGDPLMGGALYFNTASGVMKIYTGAVWLAAYVAGSIGVSTTSPASAVVVSPANYSTCIATQGREVKLSTPAAADVGAWVLIVNNHATQNAPITKATGATIVSAHGAPTYSLPPYGAATARVIAQGSAAVWVVESTGLLAAAVAALQSSVAALQTSGIRSQRATRITFNAISR